MQISREKIVNYFLYNMLYIKSEKVFTENKNFVNDVNRKKVAGQTKI